MDELTAAFSSFTGIMLITVFVLIVIQEAINGFHDAANAIATVIYANALTPMQAVSLAAVFNFLGVLIGGTAVAFSLVYLLPQNMVAGINTQGEAAIFAAMIVAAVIWNFGTWWLGIPNSTTHAYIGSIIGAAMADAFVHGQAIAGQINWHQGEKIMIALIVSPIVGFLLGYILLRVIRATVKDKELYEPVEEGKKPGKGIRSVLIAGAAGVSLMHGSNDGQKSIGLMMIVLFGLFPAVYGLDPDRLSERDYTSLKETVANVESIAQKLSDSHLMETTAGLTVHLGGSQHIVGGTDETSVATRREILDLHTSITKTLKDEGTASQLNPTELQQLQYAHTLMRDFVEHVPFWIILLSALALGGGTAVGYRRIVTTLGEKMGSSRMNPAQGTAAQISAVISIGLADAGGLPVSTTHVLSSSVIGSVAATPHQTINTHTLARIAMTWVTTLPGTMVLSFALGVGFFVAFG
jgi:phosphate/sulfate permease